MNGLTRQLGTEQGRIEPAHATAVAGDYVFCLGFDDPKHFEVMTQGDYVEVNQTATFPAGTTVVRSSLTVRPPSAAPAGSEWAVQLRLDDVPLAEQVLLPGGPVRQRKFACGLVGVNLAVSHKLAFRLIFRPTGAVSPTVTSITPSTGLGVGGDSVSIAGAAFTSTESVTLDGVALASFTVVSDTLITGVTASHMPHNAPGNVVVSTVGGSATLTNAWEYIEMLTGLLSARPAAAVAGRAYFATDTLYVYIDTGTAWDTVAAPPPALTPVQSYSAANGGAAATTQTSNATATALPDSLVKYGTLGTPYVGTVRYTAEVLAHGSSHSEAWQVGVTIRFNGASAPTLQGTGISGAGTVTAGGVSVLSGMATADGSSGMALTVLAQNGVAGTSQAQIELQGAGLAGETIRWTVTETDVDGVA